MPHLSFDPLRTSPSGREAVRYFCTANIPSKRSKRSLNLLNEASKKTVETPFGPIVAYEWDSEFTSRPIILLIHGWSDSSATWIAFNRRLREAGYRIVAFDHPAHGATAELTGEDETILPRMIAATEAMMKWCRNRGTLHGVVGHSIGALNGFIASCESPPERLVCIAMPPAVPWFIDFFADHSGLSKADKDDLWAHLRYRFRRDMGDDYHLENVDSIRRARDLRVPVFFVQDADDMEVPMNKIHEAVQALRASGGMVESLDTEGLGHQLLLRNPKVIEKILEFLRP